MTYPSPSVYIPPGFAVPLSRGEGMHRTRPQATTQASPTPPPRHPLLKGAPAKPSPPLPCQKQKIIIKKVKYQGRWGIKNIDKDSYMYNIKNAYHEKNNSCSIAAYHVSAVCHRADRLCHSRHHHTPLRKVLLLQLVRHLPILSRLSYGSLPNPKHQTNWK